MMKLNLFSFLTSFLLGSAAFAVNPTVAKLNIYGVAVSTSADCSNPIVVGYSTTATQYDMLTNPALITGSVPAGTYQCVMLIMDARLVFTPASTTGTCTGGTSYDRVLCDGGGCTYTPPSIDANKNLTYLSDVGSSATSSTDYANTPKVLLFLSTSSTGTGSNGSPFERPAAGTWNNGLTLTSPFVVASTGGSGTFVVNFNGQINGGGGSCDLGPPTFGFR